MNDHFFARLSLLEASLLETCVPMFLQFNISFHIYLGTFFLASGIICHIDFYTWKVKFKYHFAPQRHIPLAVSSHRMWFSSNFIYVNACAMFK